MIDIKVLRARVRLTKEIMKAVKSDLPISEIKKLLRTHSEYQNFVNSVHVCKQCSDISDSEHFNTYSKNPS